MLEDKERLRPNTPGLERLTRLAMAAKEEAAGRPTTDVPVSLVIFKPEQMTNTVGSNAVPPQIGTVTLFLAHTASQMYCDLKRSAEASQSDFEADYRHYLASRAKVKPLTLDEAIAGLSQLPALADVYYRSNLISENSPVLADGAVTILEYPYNGGDIDSWGLRVEAKTNQAGCVVAFAVVRPPHLTLVERSLISKLPLEDRRFNIGTATACYALTTVAVFYVTASIIASPDEPEPTLVPDRLPAELVHGLGVAAEQWTRNTVDNINDAELSTAAERIELRRDILKQTS